MALYPVENSSERPTDAGHETVPFNINNLPDGQLNQEKMAEFIYKDMEEWPDGDVWTAVIKLKFERNNPKIRASYEVIRPKPDKIDWPSKAGMWVRENGTIRLEKNPEQVNMFEQPPKQAVTPE